MENGRWAGQEDVLHELLEVRLPEYLTRGVADGDEVSGWGFWCWLEYIESLAFDDREETRDNVIEWFESHV
jgi:hypothetical protein